MWSTHQMNEALKAEMHEKWREKEKFMCLSRRMMMREGYREKKTSTCLCQCHDAEVHELLPTPELLSTWEWSPAQHHTLEVQCHPRPCACGHPPPSWIAILLSQTCCSVLTRWRFLDHHQQQQQHSSHLLHPPFVEIACTPRWTMLCAVPVDDVAVAYNLHTSSSSFTKTWIRSTRTVRWREQHCSFRFLLGPSDDDEGESLGTFANICMSVVHRLHRTWY